MIDLKESRTIWYTYIHAGIHFWQQYFYGKSISDSKKKPQKTLILITNKEKKTENIKVTKKIFESYKDMCLCVNPFPTQKRLYGNQSGQHFFVAILAIFVIISQLGLSGGKIQLYNMKEKGMYVHTVHMSVRAYLHCTYIHAYIHLFCDIFIIIF